MVKIFTLLLMMWLHILPGLLYGQAFKILCIGNSITQANGEHTSYRFPLWKKLVDADIAVEFVGSHNTNQWEAASPVISTVYKGKTFTNVNEGHWGWRVDQLLEGHEDERHKGKLSEWVQLYTVDYALVHMGTNDIFQEQDNSQTIEEVKQVIQTLRSRNPAITILLAQLIPANKPQSYKDAIVDYNSRIRALGNSLDSPLSKVVVVDMHSGFDENTLLYDDAHPNEQGEEVMAERWFTTIKSLIVPLPVTLTRFEAQQTHDKKVKLHWQTASEQNNLYFEVQRSFADSVHFKTIGKVNGAGTTNVAKTYTYLDHAAPVADLYYRLRQVDTDGTETYSKSIHLRQSTPVTALQLYPTVVHNEHLTLTMQQLQPNQPVSLTVYAANGTLAQTINTTTNAHGSITERIKLTGLQGNGLYILKAEINGLQVQRKFIVQQ
ncbi:GDSL-type esterase/lipase family protein [Pontibacter sp. H259]|uniref:GDSL-type esterase/lipase family protein n=1 Tax=Pontibacter sp. H259 TaxID=3133421 RepID=UPI0030C372BD